MRQYIFLLLLIVFASCSSNRTDDSLLNENKKIIIEGELDSGANDLVTLDRMEPTAFAPVDSTRCDKNGKFRLEIESGDLNFYSLKYTENGYITIIASPGDKIEIKGVSEQLYPYEVSGSKASVEVRNLAYRHKEVLDELREISTKSAEILGDPEFSKKKQELNIKFDSITASFHQFSREFILKNPDSPAILIALYNQYGPGLPVFNPVDDLNIYRFVDSALYKNYPENTAVQALHSHLTNALQQIKNANKKDYLKTGMKAPDFVLPDPIGKLKSLKEFKGSVVLIQIWASWSKPSMDENVYLNNCMEQFGTKGLKIIQISLDDDREAWETAIAEMNPDIIQLSDLRRWESSIVSLYQVERIPANFLLNPEGVIIEKDIFAKEMSNKIAEHLTK